MGKVTKLQGNGLFRFGFLSHVLRLKVESSPSCLNRVKKGKLRREGGG